MTPFLWKLVVIGAAILPLASGEPATSRQRGPEGVRAGQSRQEPQISLSADLVEVLVTVADSKGRPVRGLAQSNFEVLDDGARQEVSHFSDQDGPISLGVVLDATGMAPDAVGGILGALRRSMLVEQAPEVSFLAMNERASVAMGFVGTGDHVLPELRFADPHGPLSLREALACVQGGLRSPPSSRTLILLITDGGTSAGPRGIDNGVESGQAQLYAVFPTVPDPGRGRGAADRANGYPSSQWWRAYSLEAAERNLNRAAASRVARRSGGRALYSYAESEQAWIELFDRIAEEASNQYSIGFYPTTTEPGWHRIAVRITPKAMGKDLTVSHRPGYRASR